MTDPTSLVAERVDKLLSELDPATTDQVEFRGRQYDLGLAWVHFPEGFGGLGIKPIHQRDVDRKLYGAGAKPPGSRHFFGLTMAGPTMVTNGKAVYAFFESAGLFSYDVDGKLLWKKSLGGIAKAGLGPGTSPVLFEDLIILQCDQEMGGGFIVALKQSDGSEVWRVTRKNRRSWATPLLVKAPNRTELVASGAESVIAYDPRTGKQLWTGPGTVGHPIPSSVAGDGVVIASAGSSERGKRAIAIKPGGDGEIANTPQILWQRDKNTAYVPSPILHGKYVYLMTDKGLVTCLDAHTGELLYEGGRPPVPATFTASLVAYGERLLMTSEDGDTFVIKAGPQHEVLKHNTVGEPVWASLAFARGTIYIRGAEHLFAVR